MKKHGALLKLVGENILYYRKLRRFSLEKLSVRSKLNIDFINRVERGLMNISIVSLEKIAIALNVEPKEFFITHAKKPEE